jgi:ubiquitin carboxyl-terminal hydrolase 5/13
LELNECHHTKNLDQSTSTTIAEKSLAHCGECDLKANLWLCMVCGHLGCGRKNYDGTGGNNHAIDHANSSHHPVVCKLGTITPEGSASIYCYDCDEEVLDKNLGAHLAKLGIKIG